MNFITKTYITLLVYLMKKHPALLHRRLNKKQWDARASHCVLGSLYL